MKLKNHSIKLFDAVIILFCLLSGTYLFLGINQLDQITFHLMARIGILTVIFFITRVTMDNQRIMKLLRNFYPLLILPFFYSETDYYNNLLFNNLDPLLINLEKLLFNTQLSLRFPEAIPQPWFSEMMHGAYFSYYLMTLGIPLLIYLKKPGKFNFVMFIITFSFCSYYILFFLFPSTGPQFYFPKTQQVVPEGYLFQKIMHFILEVAETETGAFPSSHVGLGTVFLILIYKYFKKFSWMFFLLYILLILSTIYIKAHYAIDTLAGIITGILFYFSGKFIFKRFSEKNSLSYSPIK
jgi:membrane-associated phospholipid phosphatase